MTYFTLSLLAIGLSMDAFAVSICKGLAMKKLSIRNTMIIGLWFGVFQAIMPIIGYYLGVQFKNAISSIDHWIAFILLAIIGGNMIRESFDKDDGNSNDSINIKIMFMLAIATSIDALAVGITFSLLNINLIQAVSLIGFITFSLSIFGVIVGHSFGMKYKSKAELTGGIILILIGGKILLEHMEIF